MSPETSDSSESFSQGDSGTLSRREFLKLASLAAASTLLASCGIRLGESSLLQLPEDEDEKSVDEMFAEISLMEAEVAKRFVNEPRNLKDGFYMFGTLSEFCSSTLTAYKAGELTSLQQNGDLTQPWKVYPVVEPHGNYDDGLKNILLSGLYRVMQLTPAILAMLQPVGLRLETYLGHDTAGNASSSRDRKAMCTLAYPEVAFISSLISPTGEGSKLFIHEQTHIAHRNIVTEPCLLDSPNKTLLDLIGMKRLMKYSYYFASLTKQTQDLYFRNVNKQVEMPNHSMELGWWAYGDGSGQMMLTFFSKLLKDVPLNFSNSEGLDFSVLGKDVREINWDRIDRYYADESEDCERPSDKDLELLSRFVLRNSDFFKQNYPYINDLVMDAVVNHAAHVHQYPFDFNVTREELLELSQSASDSQLSEYFLSIMRNQEAWLGLLDLSMDDLIKATNEYPKKALEEYKKFSSLNMHLAEAMEVNLRARFKDEYSTATLVNLFSLNGLTVYSPNSSLGLPTIRRINEKWELLRGSKEADKKIHSLEEIKYLQNDEQKSPITFEFVTISKDSPNVYLVYADNTVESPVVRIAGPYSKKELGDYTNNNNFTFLMMNFTDGIDAVIPYKTGGLGLGSVNKGLAFADIVEAKSGDYALHEGKEEDSMIVTIGWQSYKLSSAELQKDSILQKLVYKDVASVSIAPAIKDGGIVKVDNQAVFKLIVVLNTGEIRTYQVSDFVDDGQG